MRRNRKIPFWVVFWTALFVFFQIWDGILTSVGVYLYGLEFEANPVAAYTFNAFGIYLSAVAWKLYSCSIFFALLLYCWYLPWSTLDVLKWMFGRKPKKSKGYAMGWFYLFGGLVTFASFCLVCGWIYALVTLAGVN